MAGAFGRFNVCVVSVFLMSIGAKPVMADHFGQRSASNRAMSAAVPRIASIGSDRVVFTTAMSETVRMVIYDIMGRPIYNGMDVIMRTETVGGRGEFKLDLSRQPSGGYLIVLSNSAGSSATLYAIAR